VEEINASLLRKARQMEAGDDTLVAGMHVLRSQAGAIPAEKGGKLHRMFQFYDKDDRGLISGHDFRRAFHVRPAAYSLRRFLSIRPFRPERSRKLKKKHLRKPDLTH
jgi:hypothetical protein